MFVEEYGWKIEDINRLTLYQAFVFSGAFCPEDGKVKLSPDEARNLVSFGGRRARKELKRAMGQ